MEAPGESLTRFCRFPPNFTGLVFSPETAVPEGAGFPGGELAVPREDATPEEVPLPGEEELAPEEP